MSQIQRGDMVGLFFEYGPESCVYLGLAEFIGPEDPPEGLAVAGKFDGKHIRLSSRALAVIDEKQMVFRLLESGETVYEQEAWYTPQARVQYLLDNCKKVHEGKIDDLRAICREKLERRKTLPLVAEGFLEVHISFNKAPIPSNDEDYDADTYLRDAIVRALGCVGFMDDEIDIKVRSLELKRKED